MSFPPDSDFRQVTPPPELRARLEETLAAFQAATKEYSTLAVAQTGVPDTLRSSVILQLTFGLSALIKSVSRSYPYDMATAKEHYAGTISGVVGGVVMVVATMPPALRAEFIKNVILGLCELGPGDDGPSQEVH
jgi:hypothetical protein